MKKIDFSQIISKASDGIGKLTDRIGKLSRLYRILIFLGIFSVLIGPFVYFIYLPKIQEIDRLKNEHEKLELRLTKAKNKARQLKSLQARMKELQTEFTIAKKKLPEKKEIPSLLASVSQSGQDAGLEFLLFQPKPEVKKEFYAEIPVAIKVTGGYHNVALFFDKVARLSRIVNMDNINMSEIKKGDKLNTSCTAITYRFVEAQPQQGKKKKS
jgi:type IV pilus assembly protein PilO